MRPQRRKDKKMADGRLLLSSAITCTIALLFIASSLLFTGCKKEETKHIPANQLTVEYSIDRETIHVGDPVELIVTAYYPTNSILELPEVGRQKDLVLLNRDWENKPHEDGLTQSETRYSITSFRLGKHPVSTNTIICRLNDKTLTAPFPEVTLSVVSSLSTDASNELADIKPVHKLQGRIPPWIWISLLVAASAFLIGWLTSRTMRNRPTEKPAPPPIPPHVIAFKALEALYNKGLLEKDECNPFYTELSVILRAYLEGRFHLNAPDETTEEIVIELSRSPELNGTQRNILQEFMRQADMVKFAKGHPDRTTMEKAYETTKQFIEGTKQTEEIATKEHKETQRDNE